MTFNKQEALRPFVRLLFSKVKEIRVMWSTPFPRSFKKLFSFHCILELRKILGDKVKYLIKVKPSLGDSFFPPDYDRTYRMVVQCSCLIAKAPAQIQQKSFLSGFLHVLPVHVWVSSKHLLNEWILASRVLADQRILVRVDFSSNKTP